MTEELGAPELMEELRRHLLREPSEIMLIAPAVEKTPFHHALGDVDTASREAQLRLDTSLAELRRSGISALGQVGDSDPVVAAEDALRQYPADEVVIVAHTEDQARWFEDGLFERAQEALYPSVRMIAVRHEEATGEARIAGTKEAPPGRKPPAGRDLPRFTRGARILIAVVGGIVTIVLVIVAIHLLLPG
jgi:hypothetical protein